MSERPSWLGDPGVSPIAVQKAAAQLLAALIEAAVEAFPDASREAIREQIVDECGAILAAALAEVKAKPAGPGDLILVGEAEQELIRKAARRAAAELRRRAGEGSTQ